MTDDIEKKLEKTNRAKYGEKNFDQISQNFRISKERGNAWCAENIKRYLDRFTRPGSTKANNLTDLLKAKDYLERMIEQNPEASTTEIIENFKSNENE